MRCRYSGLILCLSIVFSGYYCAFAQKQNQSPEGSSDTARKEIEINPENYKEAIQSINQILKKYPTAAEISEISNAIQSINQTFKRFERKNEMLSAKLNELDDKYERIMVSTGAFEFSNLKLAELIDKNDALIEKYNELSKIISEQQSNVKNNQDNAVTEAKQDKNMGDERIQQQYMKVKVREKGHEMELCLDPGYVDMNVEVMRKNKDDSTAKNPLPEAKEENLDRIVNYVSESIKKTPKVREDEPVINKEVLNDLFDAQRLYYAKKYTQALKAVQKSISKQETALGYALEGSIYFTLGDLDLAIESWKLALQLDPAMDEVKSALNKYRRR